MSKIFLNQMHANIVSTLVAFFILTVLYLIIYGILQSHAKTEKAKQRYKIRLFYIIVFIFLFIVTKIWVDGFTHLLAILSLVSAALVITNKELIMNFVGGVIINWRNLFTEGDHIQISQHHGFVETLGLLYFTLYEASDTSGQRSSGRMIKIPNGLVMNNPLLNYSLTTNFLEYYQDWVLTPESDYQYAKAMFIRIGEDVLNSFYGNRETYTIDHIRRRNKTLAQLIDLSIHVLVTIKVDEPAGFQLRMGYYCYPQDKDIIDEQIKNEIIALARKDKKIKLYPLVK